MSHEGLGSSVEAKAMSDHFGRDKTYFLLASKVLFPIKTKVRVLVVSCETCQHVETGSKFERGVEAEINTCTSGNMDSIHT